MKKPLFLLLFLAGAARAVEHPSDISIGLEGGLSSGSLADSDRGTVYGARVKLDLPAPWSAAARLQSRTFHRKDDDSQRTQLRSLAAVAFYNFDAAARWRPYLFAELGLSHNRSTVYAVTRSAQEPMVGLGAGVELRPLPFNGAALELSHRRFAGASPGAHQVTETALSLVASFYVPDDWIPIRPPVPLKIPDADEVSRLQPSVAGLGRQQASQELDRINLDVIEGRAPAVRFEPGRSEVPEAAYETLDIVGTLLRRYPEVPVLIAAPMGEAGTPEEQRSLAAARAQAVKEYLAQNFGLSPDNLASADPAAAGAPVTFSVRP